MVTGDVDAVSRAGLALSMDGYRVGRLDVEHREGSEFPIPQGRYPVAKNVSFEKGRKEVSTSAPEIRTVEIGEYKVTAPVAGFFDHAQTRAVADAIALARESMDGSKDLRTVCGDALAMLREKDASEGTGMAHAQARAVDMAAVLLRHPQMLFIRR